MIGFVHPPLLGSYADRHGRKKGLLLTITLMAVATLVIGISPTFQQVGYLRMIENSLAGELGEFSDRVAPHLSHRHATAEMVGHETSCNSAGKGPSGASAPGRATWWSPRTPMSTPSMSAPWPPGPAAPNRPPTRTTAAAARP